MQGTDGLRPGEAAPEFRERRKKKGGVFLWVTPLLETCQLHFESTGQRYCAIVSANLDRK